VIVFGLPENVSTRAGDFSTWRLLTCFYGMVIISVLKISDSVLDIDGSRCILTYICIYSLKKDTYFFNR
jgi:hypothetical protein